MFTCALCTFPLGLALYGDTFRPSTGGPFNLGMAFVGFLITCVLVIAAFAVFAIWTWGRWQKLHRIEKENPLAATNAKKRS